MASRAEERDDLMVSLGALVEPIRQLVVDVSIPRSRIPYVESKYQQDKANFLAAVSKFCKPAGHSFDREHRTIRLTLNGIDKLFDQGIINAASCRRGRGS